MIPSLLPLIYVPPVVNQSEESTPMLLTNERRAEGWWDGSSVAGKRGALSEQVSDWERVLLVGSVYLLYLSSYLRLKGDTDQKTTPWHLRISVCNYKLRTIWSCHCLTEIPAAASSIVIMYGEHQDQETHYTVPNYLQPSASLTSSANILNYDPTSPHHASSGDHVHNQEFQDVQYKREPSTPTCPVSQEYHNYPSAFTPSPSLSGSESPRTPNSYYQSPYPPTLEAGERLTVPYPAPTPPLSATHLAKEAHHVIPDTEVKFNEAQIDCICDSLQQRKDMTTLGKKKHLQIDPKMRILIRF